MNVLRSSSRHDASKKHICRRDRWRSCSFFSTCEQSGQTITLNYRATPKNSGGRIHLEKRIHKIVVEPIDLFQIVREASFLLIVNVGVRNLPYIVQFLDLDLNIRRRKIALRCLPEEGRVNDSKAFVLTARRARSE